MNVSSLRRHKRMKFFVCAIICVFITMMLGYHYRLHLLWICSRHRLGLDKSMPFQSCTMPYVPVPSTWIKHNQGNMVLFLPPEFHADDVTTDNPSVISGKRYQRETKTVFASFPEDYRNLFEWTCTMYNIRLRSSISTLPMLRYECYRTASTEFSWAMSPSDAYWYISCAILNKAIRIMQDGKAELLFNDEIDGIAMIGSNGIVVFEWQCKKTSLGGYIHFHNGDESKTSDADNDWIRAVCQSLKIVDSNNDIIKE